MKSFSFLLFLALAMVLPRASGLALTPNEVGLRFGKEFDEPLQVRTGEIFVLTSPFYEKPFEPTYGTISLNGAGALALLRADKDWSAAVRLGPSLNWSEPLRLPLTLRADISPTILSQKSLAGRQIGGLFHLTSGFQVDLKISSNYSVHYRIQHTSNAGTRSPNPGLDLHFIGFSRKL